MSSGLITVVGTSGQTTTLTISRPGGHSTTDTISVSASVPGAPTASNATAQTSGSLTFPVTLNASGDLPTALAWRYSTDNATWTNGSEITLTSPTLGQALSETVNVPSASTLYYVQFAEKNGTGTSAFCTSVTGTTSATTSFDTTTYNATTGVGIGGSTGTPLQWDVFDATRYPTDTSFRAKISSGLSTYSDATKVGTGDVNTALYHDGSFVDLATLDNTIQYSGNQTLRQRIVGANGSASSPLPQLAWAFTGSHRSMWFWVRRRYDTNFTNVGDATGAGATFNAGQNASFKIGPAANYGVGRANLEISSGTGQTGALTVDNYAQNGGTANGITSRNPGDSAAPMYSDGNWYDLLFKADQYESATDGNTRYVMTCWRRKQGDSGYTRWGNRLVTSAGQVWTYYFQGVRITSLNYNQSRSTDLGYNMWGAAMWDAGTVTDPLGVLAAEAGATPTSVSLGAVSAQTTSSATFPLTIGRYAGYIRPVVDGVEQTAQEAAVSPDQEDGSTYSVTVTGLATGAHTISFNVYNKNKTAHVTTGNQSVTI